LAWTPRSLSDGLAATAQQDTELDTLLGRALSGLRWATVIALFLLAFAQPIVGRVGVPTWTLILAFAGYSWVVSALRPHVPWLRSPTRMAIMDLVVVGALYAMGASPGGPLFVLLLLISVCAAAASPFPRSLVYTVAVILIIAIVAPTLPLWKPAGIQTAIRDMLARMVIVGFVSTMTGLLVGRLWQEHQAARSSREKAERHAELDRLRGVFVSSVSHDLRTPLTAMRAGLGMLELSLHDRLRSDEEQLLATARRNSDRLSLLIDDLLTYHQLEAGTLQLARTPLDLGEVVRGAVSTVRPLLEEKGQRVTIDLGEPLPSAGDQHRLEQALVNVLANAHQHTPAGTWVHITRKVTPQELILAIADDGPGIPEEDLERVFGRFYRLAPAGGGSGLGLAIARSIVELHGGRVWAESAGGHGTSVYVALPRRQL
jgi:signal transduction histidine kinase